MSPHDNRRRHYWIDPGFQGRYLARILALELLVAAATALLSFLGAVALVSPGFSLGAGWAPFLIGFIVLIVVVGAVLVWLGVRVSHKICGPVYRIKVDLAEIRASGRRRHIKLRDGDELKDLVAEINATLDRFTPDPEATGRDTRP